MKSKSAEEFKKDCDRLAKKASQLRDDLLHLTSAVQALNKKYDVKGVSSVVNQIVPLGRRAYLATHKLHEDLDAIKHINWFYTSLFPWRSNDQDHL